MEESKPSIHHTWSGSKQNPGPPPNPAIVGKQIGSKIKKLPEKIKNPKIILKRVRKPSFWIQFIVLRYLTRFHGFYKNHCDFALNLPTPPTSPGAKILALPTHPMAPKSYTPWGPPGKTIYCKRSVSSELPFSGNQCNSVPAAAAGPGRPGQNGMELWFQKATFLLTLYLCANCRASRAVAKIQKQ